jgi:serine/threonine protein kinase
MWASNTFSLEEIGIEGTYVIPQIPTINVASVSRYNVKEKKLYTNKNQERAQILLEKQIDHGSYGNVHLAKRDDKHVLLKQPRMAEMNLLQEAVLQHLAHKTLEAEGLPWAIPKVYDVFLKGQEIWFSMERIYGIGIPEWFTKTQHGDRDTFFLLAQMSLILATLENHLNLDHRDLKISNLLIRQEPCKIKVKLADTVWTLQSPFTVVVLDFGFACLGSEVVKGKPLVNLGDGVLPPMDPCPKEGRDIFHLLISLLGLPIFREKVSQRVHEKIDGWLSVGKKTYGSMARKWSSGHWSYLVSSQPNFAITTCCPLSILQDLLPELEGFLIRENHK